MTMSHNFQLDVIMASSTENITGLTIKNGANVDGTKVADAAFDKEIRIIVLYVEIFLGAIGGLSACFWLWFNRRRKSRVNLLIFHMTVSDLLVIFLVCVPQLIWEYDRQWKAGLIICKVLKFVQSFSMMASNYMLVVLSIDRMLAIRWPLRTPIPVWKMSLTGWSLAAFLSLPQLGVYHLNTISNSQSPLYNMTVCESIWRLRHHYERQIYLSFIGIVVFYIPFIIIMICYVSILLGIRNKAADVTGPSSLTKAEIKTMKMTIVILTAFVICGLPYHILEGIYSFGDHTIVLPIVAAIIGGMAVANSAVNPYVLLAFNINPKCVEGPHTMANHTTEADIIKEQLAL